MPGVFYDLLPREWTNLVDGWNQRENRREQSEWERTRWMTTILLNPHTKKRIKPKDLIVFPWEHNQIFWLDPFLRVWIQQNRCHPTCAFPLRLFAAILPLIPAINQIGPFAWQQIVKHTGHQPNLTERKCLQIIPCG